MANIVHDGGIGKDLAGGSAGALPVVVGGVVVVDRGGGGGEREVEIGSCLR